MSAILLFLFIYECPEMSWNYPCVLFYYPQKWRLHWELRNFETTMDYQGSCWFQKSNVPGLLQRNISLRENGFLLRKLKKSTGVILGSKKASELVEFMAHSL